MEGQRCNYVVPNNSKQLCDTLLCWLLPIMKVDGIMPNFSLKKTFVEHAHKLIRVSTIFRFRLILEVKSLENSLFKLGSLYSICKYVMPKK